MKYIRDSVRGFIIWTDPRTSHSATAEAEQLKAIKSAGFIFQVGDKLICNGGSMTLSINSLPEDTEILAEYIRPL